MYKSIAVFLLPFFIIFRKKKSLNIFYKVKLEFYNILGSRISSTVRIESNVDLLGLKNIEIGSNSFIGKRSRLIAYEEKICIGNNVLIAANTTVITRSHHYENVEIPIIQQGYNNSRIVIEDDVWIGSNCVILAGVTIRKGAVIAANSVVSKNVEEYKVVGGVPAKVIKNRSEGKHA